MKTFDPKYYSEFLDWYNKEFINNKHYKISEGMIDLLNIDQFNELVKDHAEVAITRLDYPFYQKPYYFALLIDNPLHVIEQIIAALVYVFSTAKPLEKNNRMYNDFFHSDLYGESCHSLDQLVLESILLDSKSYIVHIGLGS